jgi:hypothetical protein
VLPGLGSLSGAMHVQVDTRTDEAGIETLSRIRLGERDVEVTDNLDCWHGDDHRYVKLRGDDGNLYVLRLDALQDAWELALFQTARATALAGALDRVALARLTAGHLDDE